MKSYKKILTSVVAISALFFSYIFIRVPIRDYLCNEGTAQNRDCVAKTHSLDPVVIAFIPLLLVSVLLFFVRREVFTAWAKFAIIGFPVMLGGLLYAFNIEQSTGSWIGGPTEAQIASFLLPGLFLLISIIIIITKSIKLRRVR